MNYVAPAPAEPAVEPVGPRPNGFSHGSAYRPEIDGLRAVAVLGVLLYHVSPAALPGGFLGVDAFFVISGYLITRIIRREAELGSFSFGRFFARRIRRLAPALLAMMLVVATASSVLLLPSDLLRFSWSGLATLASVSNIYFWRDVDYFSGLAADKPLLHTWSLGVEEQFYLLAPALLVLALKLRSALPAVLIATGASFALNVYLLQWGGDLPAFYLLPARAWQLGAGAALALSATRLPPWAGWAGAALVAAGMAGLRDPGLPQGLPVVAGTAVLIAAAGPRLLATRPLVAVGLISYSLYLWHWPILALARYYAVDGLGLWWTAAAVAASFAAAALSWRFVERPFRRMRITDKPFAGFVGLGTLTVAAAFGALIGSGGMPWRFAEDVRRLNAAAGSHFRCAPADTLRWPGARGCRLAGDPSAPEIILFGNSNAQMFAPLVSRLLVERGQSGVLVSFNGCRVAVGANLSESCRQIVDASLAAVAASPAALVIVGTSWDGPRTELEEALAGLRRAGKRIVLIGPLAPPGYSYASVEARRHAFDRPAPPTALMSAAALDRRFRLTDERARSDIHLLRPDLIQCRSGRCEYRIEGVPLFSDHVHLAASALPLFESQFRAALGDRR